MAARGSLDSRERKKGILWGARLPLPGRPWYPFGGDWEGWDEARADAHLDVIAEQIAKGTFVLPKATKTTVEQQGIRFDVFASEWYDRYRRRLKDPDGKSAQQARWRLEMVMDSFGGWFVDEINVGHAEDFVDAMLKENEAIKAAESAGCPLIETYVDKNGKRYSRARRPLANDSINKGLKIVMRVLKSANGRGLVAFVPDLYEAKLEEKDPNRSFLEPAQIVAVLDAAAEIDKEIVLSNRPFLPRLSVVKTLLLSGVRISELCHTTGVILNLSTARYDLTKGKTTAAERKIPMLGALVEELCELQMKRPWTSDGYPFGTAKNKPNNKGNLNKRFLKPVHKKANELLEAQGEKQIARLTPHTFRRTFASMLAVCEIGERRAMYLLGHTDSRMTLSVYQQALDRADPSWVSHLESALGCSLDQAKVVFDERPSFRKCQQSVNNTENPGSISLPETWRAR